MAGDWIKVEHSLPTKPEVLQLADLLDISEATVVGLLVGFWIWVDTNVSESCPVVYGTMSRIDALVGHDGFSEAMATCGWLSITGDQLRIPGYEHHLSQTAKQRGVEARRKQKQRRTMSHNVRDICPDVSRTKTGPEKRREEKRREEVDDHLVSWSVAFGTQVLSSAKRMFRGGTPPVFPDPLKPEDRELLLKVAALCEAGKISGALVTECCEAIRHHDGPVGNRAAYFTTVLYDQAEVVGVNVKQLLAKVVVPKQLLTKEDQ